ncbi:MAG: glycyl-radical enzyme activating protein [Clostridia bacterium]|nr:glycyl-radical enzyme activating protein [Clostridia bacterium]
MYGVISDVKRMEIHDGDGLRTTVFFKGCPLKCLWCHNPESISFEPQTARFKQKCIGCGTCRGENTEETAKNCPADALVFYGRRVDTESLVSELMQDAPFFRESGGGVTLSGGECLAQPDFAVSVARALFEKGISVDIDTCGFVPRESFERILPFTDVFLYDIKAVDPAVHAACTGRDNSLILDNLRFLSKAGAKIEIRYPLAKGFNDGECEKIGALLKDMPGVRKIKVLRCHSYAASRYEALGMPCPLPDSKTGRPDVERAVSALRSYGLPAVNGMDGD